MPTRVARSVGILLVLVAVAAVAAIFHQSLSAAHGNFSLTLTMRDAPAGSYYVLRDQVRSDGTGAYVDKSDPGGTTPAVYSDGRYGNIVMDLTGSLRTLCVTFEGKIQDIDMNVPAPLPGCFAAYLTTLAGPTGVTRLSPGSTGEFGMRITWTGLGTDGNPHNYILAFNGNLIPGSGITASAGPANSNGDVNSWTVTPNFVNGHYAARVRLHILTGKQMGYYDIADYDMPFSFIATRQIPNLR